LLRRFPVPIPPKIELQEIVIRIEAFLNLTDAIEKRVEMAKARADKMTQAILAKAFRGELISTDAELARRESRPYEPASALLSKIKAKRKDIKPQRKRKSAQTSKQ
jgi:type I restriction enzyme S subunit